MIEVVNHHPFLRFPALETQRTVRRVLRGERKSIDSVSIVFTHHRLMKQINRKFLRHDRTTDVISFSFDDREGVQSEIYVNLDQARRQAGEFGVSFRTETQRLLIHGTLHTLGYDDSTRLERARMRRKEDQYLSVAA